MEQLPVDATPESLPTADHDHGNTTIVTFFQFRICVDVYQLNLESFRPKKGLRILTQMASLTRVNDRSGILGHIPRLLTEL